jgi:hypothetical protein
MVGQMVDALSALLTFRVTAPAAGSTSTGPSARIFTVATVRATEPDPDLPNNQLEATTTVRAACAPRPRVELQTRPLGNGRLEVVVVVGTTPEQQTNVLSSLRFTQIVNGRVSVDGQAAQTGPFTFTLPPNRQAATLIVERVQGGQATTVSFEAADVCGVWPTVVGGGPAAF